MNFLAQLQATLDSVPVSKKFELLGDFNAKVTEWYPVHPTDAAGRCLKELSSTQALTQVVGGPPFGIESKSPSLLYVVFLNKPTFFKKCGLFPPIADHCLTCPSPIIWSPFS